jgi:hypothetical protein
VVLQIGKNGMKNNLQNQAICKTLNCAKPILQNYLQNYMQHQERYRVKYGFGNFSITAGKHACCQGAQTRVGERSTD